ncbi:MULTISPECIES: hypothetical protein [unclassified Nostoc]|uniref:hypothetical protein n=1 Tax=unclassified Nostoc TaxID=2593658 RepID=UPI002AD47C92|nr:MULTISPECIES: hypothetical protein [unclassified Nostoc]MDZ8124243.1 hypothetical protein [Nostoc sp. CmiVER01]MDZ8228172.1 hypothetical protein [Nostoc sp. ChiVER01]
MPIETIPGTSLQYYLVAFDAVVNERDEPQGKMSQKLLDILSGQPITDVFIFSHGWMSDVTGARQQYNKWIGAMHNNLNDIAQIEQARSEFHPLLIGLYWPSLPWGNEELSNPVSFDSTSTSPLESLIEQYAQRIADTDTSRQALHTIFQAAMENITPDYMPSEVRQAYEVLNQESGLGNDGEGAAPGSDRLSFDPESIFEAAKAEPVDFGQFNLSGILMPLRVLSFWKMKDRARQIGETGGFELLAQLQKATANTVRFHLMGHSFGCIVVSAMLAGPRDHNTLVRSVNSVALVQGALSLWSYCADIPVLPGRPGYFHSVVADNKVSGPIVTTQTELDAALGKMYPLAAGIRHQIVFETVELPKFGALGTFGVRGPGLEIVNMKMLSVSEAYPFTTGKIYNLDSTQYICDTHDGIFVGAHNDIAKPEVAHAVWQAVLAS